MTFKRILALSCLVLIMSLQANAIIIRHDKSDKDYIQDERRFPAIFPLHDDGNIKNCVGTLITPQWAITAAHCTILIDKGSMFLISSQAAEVSSVHVHPAYGEIKGVRNENGDLIDIIENIEDPAYDVALIKLRQPLKHVTPISLVSKAVAVDQLIQVMGWGDFGEGTEGISREQPVNDRQFRLAHNKIEALEGNFLVFTFDAPDSHNTLPLEGVNGPGDSGSPALIYDRSDYFIAGISSGGSYPDDQQQAREGKYGWREFYVNIDAIKPWIMQITNQ